MKNNKLLLILSAFFIVGCISAYMLYCYQPEYKNDVVQINRIEKEVIKNWREIKARKYKYQDDVNKNDGTKNDGTKNDGTKNNSIKSNNTTYPFCVLSNENQILYQSSPKATTSVSSALARGDIFLSAVQNGEILGKIIITTNMKSTLVAEQKKLALFLFLSITIIYILFLSYYFYLYKNILKPFQSLEVFAKEIANGNLDFPLKMDKNNIFGSFTQSFDLMREQLTIAKHQEFLANQSKKELVASLSHDIKTPVTSIKLTSELLMVTTEDEKLKGKLGTIYQKAEQINLLVTDLFHATLEDLDKLVVNPVETYSDVLKSIILEADCYDRIHLSDIPECILSVDPLRLNQVIANVIYNSYKYAATKIDIHFEMQDGYLWMKIQDYGEGVIEDELPLLFNKFYRGKNATTESGSGLGLYICKKLLEQMRGEIYCSNNESGFLTCILLRLA